MATITAPRRKQKRLNPRRAEVVRPARSERGLEKQAILDSMHPDRLNRHNIDWPVLGWMVAMHVGALAAPFFFTWQALGVTVFLHWLTLSIGICLGYHRFLSHKSMRLRTPVEFFVTLCGVLSGEGTPLAWASTHRLHHQQSDKEGDPHSPLDGPWWSHIMWLFVKHTPAEKDALYRRYVPELKDRPVLQMFERTYGLWLIGTGVILFAIGGWPMLLWGLCARMTFAYHSTWFVNSATHLWGYRNYDTRDESRNLWWVAVVSYGEGWHNNHHAHPANARAGHKWYEIDPTFWVIKLLKVTGLAYDVKDAIPQQQAA
jgi:stearoyl-CoA desaturase (delta-9 desaturase)